MEFATDHSSYLLIDVAGDRKNYILIDAHTLFGLSFCKGDFDAIKKRIRGGSDEKRGAPAAK